MNIFVIIIIIVIWSVNLQNLSMINEHKIESLTVNKMCETSTRKMGGTQPTNIWTDAFCQYLPHQLQKIFCQLSGWRNISKSF